MKHLEDQDLKSPKSGILSHGTLLVNSNVTLMGDGPQATIIRLKSGYTSDLSGVVRTPSGVAVHNVTFTNFGVDMNGDNWTSSGNTGRQIAFYTGVSPSYVENNPITGTDLDGHSNQGQGTGETCNHAEAAMTQRATERIQRHTSRRLMQSSKRSKPQ